MAAGRIEHHCLCGRLLWIPADADLSSLKCPVCAQPVTVFRPAPPPAVPVAAQASAVHPDDLAALVPPKPFPWLGWAIVIGIAFLGLGLIDLARNGAGTTQNPNMFLLVLSAPVALIMFVCLPLAILAVLIALYVAPIIIAVKRKHPNVAPIAVITVLLGWTIVGYAVALAWAFIALPENHS
jgi:hypothetical protein